MSATENGKPPRMTISRALEMALLNRQARQPSVKIIIGKGRVVGAEVFSAHDDIEEAERQARVIAEQIMSEYPPEPNGEPSYDTELTRNAKGETQIKLSATHPDPLAVADQYEALRGRYPLADGTATHDAPKPAAKK